MSPARASRRGVDADGRAGVGRRAPERVSVTTLRPLLLAALAHGAAHGTLVGEAVPFMTQHFGSAAPIEIDVRTLHQLPQPGCPTARSHDHPTRGDRPQDRARRRTRSSSIRSATAATADFPAGSNP